MGHTAVMAGSTGGALELHDLDVTRPGVLPFAVGSFDTIGPLSLAEFPHRHSFYEMGLVTHGRGAHVVDLVPRRIDPPYLYAMVPGQVHHWQDAEDVSGRLLLFNEDFLLPHPGDADALRALSARPWLRVGRAQARELLAVFRELHRECRAAAPGYIDILASYLHILLLRALRLLDPAGPAKGAREAAGVAVCGGEVPGERATELAERFCRMIALPGPGPRSVESCARELCVSAGHLHAVVKRVTGRAPGRLIRAGQILEAKRLIAGTDLTIRQVASQVGFGDPAYFGRFFRRETGVTPGAFRRALAGGGMHHDPRERSLAAPAGPA